MSVLIKGMEMPKSCWLCPLSVLLERPREMLFCRIIKEEVLRNKVDGNCPLVEVPTPHGPLVDSNRLIDIGLHLMHTAKNDDIANGVKWLWQYIIEAPTVIESEGEDESR